MAEVGGPGDGPIAEARRDNGSREMVSVGTAQCPHGARPSPPTPSSPRCHGHPAHDLAHEGGKAGGRCTSDSQGGQSAKSYRRVFCSDCRAPDGGARGGCITTALPSLPSVSVHPGAAHTDGGADDSAGKASSCRGGDPEEAKERVTVGGSLLLHTSVMDSIVKGALGMEGGAVLGGAENFKVSSSPVHVAGRFHSHAALSSGMRHRGVKQDSMTRRVYTSQSSASERAHRYHHTSRDAMPAQEDTPRLSPAPSSINIAKGTSRDRDDTVANVPEVVTGDTSGNRRDTSGMHNELHHVDSSSSVASQDCPGSTHVKPEKPLKAKRKKKLGSKKKLASGELPSEEGECDDTSSEHSVCFKPKKNKKRPRRHCDIHNPINKVPKEASCDAINSASCDGRSAVNINNQEAPREPQQTTTKGVQGRSDTKTLICTCGKGSKRPRSRVRPEPEGGSSQMPSHNGTYYDEFDKVIFSNEPIFSDMEFDAKEDAQIRTEMERYHKRSNHPDIFSAAQMVNTNTMLKFAIIGAELQNISGVSLRRDDLLALEMSRIVNLLIPNVFYSSWAESEVGALTRRIRLLEEDFEQTENRLQDATSKLEEASKAADESERGRKVLERRNITDEERIGELEKELEETILAGEEADRKYEEAARKLAITEVDLERAEARLEAAEAKINELEEELKVVGNNMKSLEISEQEASQREDSYEESIRDLTARLKDAENRATEAERTVSKLQKEVDRLEDELLGEKEKYKSISEELDTTFAELAGF